MLYPQSNKFRSMTSLNGIWNYKLVEDDYIPLNKAEKTFPMAVPASINDIVTDKRIAEYAGKVLLETEFSLPQEKDKNHPSVIMISVANEAATYEDKARDYFKEVVAHPRTLSHRRLRLNPPKRRNFRAFCQILA